MIADIFLPEKIGSYYLLAKRIVGFDINKTHIYATQLFFSGNAIVAEKFLQEPIDTDASIPYAQRVSNTLKKLSTQLDNVDEIRTSISSSIALFKELTLPFTDRDSIELVLNFELEPLLPFSLANAFINFIITKKNPEAKQTTVLVAAVQKNYVIEQINYFTTAGLKPTAVTVDMFDVYGLYKAIPSYSQKKNGVVLIDISLYTTTLAYIIDGQLKLIRTLSKGTAQVAKIIGQELSIPNGDALEQVIRFGLENNDNPNYTKAAHKAYINFFQEIQFTLQSFISQLGTEYTITEIFLLGNGAEINQLPTSMTEILGIPCLLFDSNELLKYHVLSLKNIQRIPHSHYISLSTAFKNPQTEDFNLADKELRSSSVAVMNWQLLTSLVLTMVILIVLGINTFMQTKKFEHVVTSMEREIIVSLQERQLTDAKNLTQALDDAQEKVSKEEEIWFAFSRQSRFSFLKALQELSTSIDKKATGLNLKKLIITANTITLEGEVKGFQELKILERELRESNLFIAVPPLQELTFSEKLLLKKNGEHA